MSELGEAFAGAMGLVTPPDAYGHVHGATVRVQHADGTVDLDVDDAAVKLATSVLVKVGLPGARVVLEDGQRVRLAFESSDEHPKGDPSRPYVFGLDLDPSADKGIARVDDPIDCGTITGVVAPGGGPVTFTWIPPTPPHLPVISTTLALAGVIADGSRKAFLRGD